MKGKVLFSETQSFKFTWSWWLVMGICIMMFGVFGWAMYQQLILGEPWGNKPMSDTGLIITSLLTFLLTLGIFFLFNLMKLTVEIDAGSIYYQFFPFNLQMRTLTVKDLKSVKIRKYNAIFEFGGWGYRTRIGKGKAYIIKGNMGLQLVFDNDKKLLLGTQKPKLMEAALNEMTAKKSF